MKIKLSGDKLITAILDVLGGVQTSVGTNFIMNKLEERGFEANRRQLVTCLRGLVIANKVKQSGSSKSFRWSLYRGDDQTFSKAQMDKAAQQIADLQGKLKELSEQKSKGIAEVHVKDGSKTRKIQGIFHEKFPRIMSLATARKPIFLYGPTGSGKTFIGGQVAEALDLPFNFCSCTAGMSEGQLNGRLMPTVPNKDAILHEYRELKKKKVDSAAAATLALALAGGFSYIIGQFIDTFENGGVFMLDEIDAADSNVLMVLNAALSSNRCAVPNRPHKPYAERHPDFVVMAAANTVGTGSDRMYAGRNKLDAATLDRFNVGKVFVDYDIAAETQLCPDQDLRSILYRWRIGIRRNRLERAMSTRFLIDAYDMKQAGWTIGDIEQAFFEGWREDEINKAKSAG